MHILTAKQFDREYLDKHLLGDYLPLLGASSFQGKIAATLFYEPSTRTRLSFETAMLRHGGNVISTENAKQFSSAIKGESLEDTIKVVSSYVDVIVLRHPEPGASQRASEYSSVPLINAGDGEHPTQGILDLYTIRKELGRVDGIKIAMVGDLRFGRTIHSLIHLLGLYDDIEVFLCSPRILSLPEEIKDYMINKGVNFSELTLPRALRRNPDVVYMTRTQKERWPLRMQDDVKTIIFGKEEMEKIKDDAIVMHPLPRCEEVSKEIDNDYRAAYFRQAANGVFVRAVLLGRAMHG